MIEKWVIAYDLDVKGMKKAGYTKSQVTKYYNTIRNCLGEFGFTKFTQGSIYSVDSTDNVLTKVFQVVFSLKNITDPQFINRLNVFKMDTFSDLRPLIAGGDQSVEADSIEEKIKEEFPEDSVIASAFFVRHLSPCNNLGGLI
jgi:virulence-associated protein VapD